jgi:hypothetical protein
MPAEEVEARACHRREPARQRRAAPHEVRPATHQAPGDASATGARIDRCRHHAQQYVLTGCCSKGSHGDLWRWIRLCLTVH